MEHMGEHKVHTEKLYSPPVHPINDTLWEP